MTGSNARSLSFWLSWGLLGVILSGCGDHDLLSGVDQPLRVRGAQYVHGALPGSPPLRSGSSETPREPTTTSALTETAYLRERLSNVRFSGLASRGAAAVAVRFEEYGDGYWVVPTGFPDPQAGGRASWSFVADFGASLPSGRHTLQVVAIGQDGEAGTQSRSSICIRSAVPDKGNSCFPNIRPPAVVISLAWDTPVDLDLKVVTPEGRVIESKSPSSGPTNAQGVNDPTVPTAGNLDRDSNRDCVIDGLQRESVVFEAFPSRGNYAVYASLNRACGQRSVTYIATQHVARSLGDGEFEQTRRDVGAGTLIELHASSDVTLGTFVGEVRIR